MTFEEEVSNIINNDKVLFIENYFTLQKRAEEKFGCNTLIFAEVGSFYEIYETEDVGKATEISKSLNILLTRKNKNIKEVSLKNPKLCGIPNVSLDKHLEKLSSEGKWTIVIVSQEGRPPNIKRYLDKVISPGTNIDYLQSEEKRYLASVYVEKNKNGIYSAGMTLLDPTLGEILVYENYGKTDDKEIILDEVRQIIQTYNVAEMISMSEDKGLFSGRNVVHKEMETFQINYQEELIKHSFGLDTTYLSAIELANLERMPFALNSTTMLLDFVIEHNKLIGVSLTCPIQIYSSRYMYQGNNPMSQLDVYKKDSIDLLDIVNKGITAIGRRYIKEQLTSPLKDESIILERLEKSKTFIGYKKRSEIEDLLKGIYDMERILRKSQIKTIQPFELYNLYKSLYLVEEIEKIMDMGDISFRNFLESLETRFDFDIMAMSNLTNITKTFIRGGISEGLDLLQDRLNEIESNKDMGFSDSYVLKETESEGLYYEITNKKYVEFSHELNNHEVENVKNLKNSKKIFIKTLTDLSNERILIIDKLVKITKEIFYKEIERLDIDLIKSKILFLCNIEFYINNAKLFENKYYCIPKIVKTESNFYEAEELRHPIVESLENEIFIPNNVQFGDRSRMDLATDVCFNADRVSGYLLYGQNSSGKTILSKSIGISIIMAQAGFFVPAKSLRMSIFDSIFTRISGSDNLLRGHSTFAVEMIELKNILNRADNKSMVIGDEISHGTETISGLSIVASTILSLESKKSSFIIATHLHQLDKINAVSNLKNVSQVHLSLSYNAESDKVIYNRKIQKGKGSSIYGLEYAKSLKMPQEFLSNAYNIRKEIADDISGLEELTKKQKSKYNSSVFIGICSSCGNRAEEVHHLIQKKEASDNGLVGHIRINQKGNLKPLCKKCHKEEHIVVKEIQQEVCSKNDLQL